MIRREIRYDFTNKGKKELDFRYGHSIKLYRIFCFILEYIQNNYLNKIVYKEDKIIYNIILKKNNGIMYIYIKNELNKLLWHYELEENIFIDLINIYKIIGYKWLHEYIRFVNTNINIWTKIFNLILSSIKIMN